MSLHLVPDGPPEVQRIVCPAEKVIAPHDVWNMRVITSCEEHEHPVNFVFIRHCGHCGTWTEVVKVGPTSDHEGGTFEMKLSMSEYTRFQVGLA